MKLGIQDFRKDIRRIRVALGLTNTYDFVKAYLPASVQSISTGTVTKVELAATNFDTGGDFDVSVSYDYTAPRDVYVHVNAGIQFLSMNDGDICQLRIHINGSLNSYTYVYGSAASQNTAISFSDIVKLTLGDTLDMRAYHEGGVAKDIRWGSNKTFLSLSVKDQKV